MDQEEFWKWSWAEMGIYDDVANIQTIHERTGEKVFYLGYSQGTVQMFYALAHREDDILVDIMHKFLAFAPCTICPEDGPESKWHDSLFQFPSIGVYHEYGPGYWTHSYEKIALKLGPKACTVASCLWCKPVSVFSETHWWQNTYTNRFQEYAPNFLEGERETDLIDIAGIDKIPISMIAGTADVTCPYERAVETASIIGDSIVTFNSIEGVDHGYYQTANSPEFMSLVLSQLQVPAAQSESFLTE